MELKKEVSLFKTSGQYDIDWIRVFAMFAVFSFHCGRFFNMVDGTLKISNPIHLRRCSQGLWTRVLHSSPRRG